VGGATAARHTTRAETEKASRAGQVLPARDWLREQVQCAAAGAREPAAFSDRLRVAGVVVRERRDPDGRLSGYAVGRRELAGGPPGHRRSRRGGVGGGGGCRGGVGGGESADRG